METTSRSQLSATQEANLRRYATLGLGTAVLAGAVTTADASVVYTNFGSTVLADTTTTDANAAEYEVFLASNGTFNISTTGAGNGTEVMNFFVRNEGVNNAANYAVVTAGVNGGVTSPLNFIGITVNGTSSGGNPVTYRYPSRLAAGATVGPAQTYVTVAGTSQSLEGGTLAFGKGYTNSKWAKNGKNSGYMGINFLGPDGMTHYAFFQMTVATDAAANARAITLVGAGYQTTAATAIVTAPQAVPEPTSLALLAAGGAGGIAAFRRRKKAAAAKAEAAV